MIDDLIEAGQIPDYSSQGVTNRPNKSARDPAMKKVDQAGHSSRNDLRLDPLLDPILNPREYYPHSYEADTINPTRRSQVAFEEPRPIFLGSQSYRRDNFDVPPTPSTRISRLDAEAHPFDPHSRRSHRSFNPSRTYEDPYQSDMEFNRSRYEEGRSPPSNPTRAYEIMRKWNIKYSGVRSDDPDAFLMRIEEGRDLVPICDADLLRVVPFFLSGIALNWFRGSRYLRRTYNQFTKAFRVRFGDSDFQFELRQEIHQRTQGEKVSVSDYLTCMRAMFDKLTPRMSESEEISYAHWNLLPRLHLAIHKDEIRDFEDLEHLANVVQKSYRVARNYKPPPTPERSLLPDLAYKDPRVRKTDKRYEPRQERLHLLEEDDKNSSLEGSIDVAYLSVEKTNKQDKNKKPKNTPGQNPKPSTSKTNNPNPPTPSPDNSAPPNDNRTTIKCWNCSKPGHRFQNCEESRTKFCFKCGKKDVISPECPNCSEK